MSVLLRIEIDRTAVERERVHEVLATLSAEEPADLGERKLLRAAEDVADLVRDQELLEEGIAGEVLTRRELSERVVTKIIGVGRETTVTVDRKTAHAGDAGPRMEGATAEEEHERRATGGMWRATTGGRRLM